MRKRSADESFMCEEHVDDLARHCRNEDRQVDARRKREHERCTRIKVSSQVADDSQTSEAVRSTAAADWRIQRWNTVADTRAYHDTCSGCHVTLIGASAKTGHGCETVEELVGQLRDRRSLGPQWKTDETTQTEAGLRCSWRANLVKSALPPTDLDSAVGGVAGAVRNEDAGRRVSTYERMSRRVGTQERDHQRRSRTRAWNLDSCKSETDRGHRTILEFAPVARHQDLETVSRGEIP